MVVKHDLPHLQKIEVGQIDKRRAKRGRMAAPGRGCGGRWPLDVETYIESGGNWLDSSSLY